MLNRIYDEIENPGVNAQDRALNHAVTSAREWDGVFRDAFGRGLVLNRVDVGRAVLARPVGDTWEVSLHFFDPRDRLGPAGRVYRYTVDVSDTVPVAIDVPRWIPAED